MPGMRSYVKSEREDAREKASSLSVRSGRLMRKTF